MSNFTVKSSYIKPEVTVKLAPGQALHAVEAAKSDGADNLFFEVGTDTYVATGKSLAIKTLKTGDAFEFQGQQAKVVALDNEAIQMSSTEVLAAFAAGGAVGTVGGLAAAVVSDIFGGLGSLFGVGSAATNFTKHAVVGALIGGAVIGGIALASKKHGESKLDLELMKNYGSPVNQ